MNALISENELKVVKKYEFDTPLITEIDSIIDNSIKNCIHKYFHTFDNNCEYNLNFTNITNNESVNLKISDKYIGMFELNKKLTLARERGFKFNHINKLTIKFYTPLSQNNIHRHLKFQCPILVRLILKIMSRNPETIQPISNIFHNLELVIVYIKIYLYKHK